MVDKKLTPDHKTIAKFRKDNASALKNVFRDFVKLCMKLDLYGKELAAIDGSKFRAVNSKERNFNDAKLNDRIKRLTAKIDEYLQQLDESDKNENETDGENVTNIKQIIAKLEERKTLYQSYKDELKNGDDKQKSLTDPESRLMLDHNKYDVCYNVQTSVDSKHKLIVEFEVANQGNDMKQLSNMAQKTADILEAPELTVVADTGYNNASEIAACIIHGISPQVAGSDGDICVPCKADEVEPITSHENGRGVYIPERNIFICPMGNVMYPGSYKNVDKSVKFYNGRACAKCTCRCTETKYRDFNIRMKKSEFTKKYNIDNLYVKQVKIRPNKETIVKRKELAEHPFGTIKRTMGARFALTKGIQNVTGEFSLVFLTYNLKRVLNIVGAKKLIEAMV